MCKFCLDSLGESKVWTIPFFWDDRVVSCILRIAYWTEQILLYHRMVMLSLKYQNPHVNFRIVYSKKRPKIGRGGSFVKRWRSDKLQVARAQLNTRVSILVFSLSRIYVFLLNSLNVAIPRHHPSFGFAYTFSRWTTWKENTARWFIRIFEKWVLIHHWTKSLNMYKSELFCIQIF